MFQPTKASVSNVRIVLETIARLCDEAGPDEFVRADRVRTTLKAEQGMSNGVIVNAMSVLLRMGCVESKRLTVKRPGYPQGATELSHYRMLQRGRDELQQLAERSPKTAEGPTSA